MDASADGSDVFFTTEQRLTGSDTDGAVDLYDARAGGGFPEPPPSPAPCAADSCRSSASQPPTSQSPASSSIVGPGNQHRPRPCRKTQVRRHGRCVAKRRKHHAGRKHHAKKSGNRTARHNRGGAK